MTGKHGPLSDVTVVDLTQFLSGPLSTMILADLGAEVIKIEHPDRPKANGPFLNGERTYDLSIQHSKRSITLSLKAEKDKRALTKLVRQADILVENFKPGTMERMDFDYNVVPSINPRIIHIAISGFGHIGSYHRQGALGMVIQGMNGPMSLNGESNDHPMRCETSVSDVVDGLYASEAMTAALYDREKTGNGQSIDIAMLDVTFSCLEDAVINTCITGKNPARVGNSHPTSVPFDTFPVLDGEIIIICSRDVAFYDLCRALNRKDMVDDPHFSKAEAHRQNRAQLTEEVSRITGQYTSDKCGEILEKLDIPNGHISTMTIICADPRIAAREMVVEAEHPVASKYRIAGNPIKFSQYPLTQYGPAPTLGQYTRQVFTGYLHMPQAEIDDLLTSHQPLYEQTARSFPKGTSPDGNTCGFWTSQSA